MIKLREFRPTDAASLAENANNPELARYLRDIFPSPYTLEDAIWWLTEGHKVDNVYNRAIEYNGVCIGSIGAIFFDNQHRFSAEIGYWIGSSYWGQGIATEVIGSFTNFIFSNYDIRRVFAPVAHENPGSMRALEKNGFVCEGVFKNNLFLRGVMYDEHVYAKHSEQPRVKPLL